MDTQYQSYYTKSDPILTYMTNMLDLNLQDSIFEPCGGDGVFIDKILSINPNANINIYELNPEAVSTLVKKYNFNEHICIKHTDTLLDDNIINQKVMFDKIIGNPPYGARNSEDKKELLNRFYPNLYVKESYTLFLYSCIKCLKEDGILSFIIPDTFLSLHRHLSIRQFILQNTEIKEISLFPSSFFPGINFGYANLCIITLRKSSNKASNMANKFIIRSGFSAVEELNDFSKGHIKEYIQSNIYKNMSSAFYFNSSERIDELVHDCKIFKIGDIANCVTGFYSGNDKKYLRALNKEIKNAKKYEIVSCKDIYDGKLTDNEKKVGIKGESHFVPIVKGGNRRYIKPNEWFMDWSENSIIEYRCSKKCRFQNSMFYFKSNGIAIPMVRSSKLTAALISERLFDQSIVGVFPYDDKLTLYLLAFFNSSICSKLINAINPTTNNSANYIKKIPFICPSEEQIKEVNLLVNKIITKLQKDDNDIAYYEDKLNLIFERIYELNEMLTLKTL